MARPRKSKSSTKPPTEVPATPPLDQAREEAISTTENKADTADHFVSIAAEFTSLGYAVNAAVLISEALSDGGLPTAEATARAPSAITAILTLVQARLEQVQRVVRGIDDPKTILAPHNATGRLIPEEEDHDIRLSVWDHATRAAHLARELQSEEAVIELAAHQQK